MYDKIAAVERLQDETVIMGRALQSCGFLVGLATLGVAFSIDANEYIRAAVTFFGFMWGCFLVLLPLVLVDHRIKLFNGGPGSAGQQLANPYDIHGGFYAPGQYLVYEWPDESYGDDDEEKPVTIH